MRWLDMPVVPLLLALVLGPQLEEHLRIALTAVNPYPQRVKGLEKYAGVKLDDTLLDEIRETVRTQAKPMRTTTVKPWYRRRVVGAIARRLTARLADAG